jgi:putative transposase
LNHNGYVPDFITITPAKHHDIKVSKEKYFTKLTPGSIIAMDRGYIDFKWFNSLTKNGIFFISRAKKNMNYKVIERKKVVQGKGVIKDDVIELCGFYMQKDYPEKLRLVKYKDDVTGKVYEYITNNFNLCPRTIADCYKERWQIELFFKWIKQHLKIKKFIGNSENAIQFQIWTALIYYVLLSYLKFKSKWGYSLLEISRVMKERVEDSQSMWDLFEMYVKKKTAKIKKSLQIELFKPILTGH